MASNELAEYLKDSLEKLNYLSVAAKKKCSILQQNSSGDNLSAQFRDLLNLCNKVRKNCEYFQKDLMEKAKSNNVDLEESPNNSNCEFTISLNSDVSLRTRKFNHLKTSDMDKFWTDLVNFVLNYDATINYPIDGEWKFLVRNWENMRGVEEATPDDVESRLRAIFGSDTDEDLTSPRVLKKQKEEGVQGNISAEKTEECLNIAPLQERANCNSTESLPVVSNLEVIEKVQEEEILNVNCDDKEKQSEKDSFVEVSTSSPKIVHDDVEKAGMSSTGNVETVDIIPSDDEELVSSSGKLNISTKFLDHLDNECSSGATTATDITTSVIPESTPLCENPSAEGPGVEKSVELTSEPPDISQSIPDSQNSCHSTSENFTKSQDNDLTEMVPSPDCPSTSVNIIRVEQAVPSSAEKSDFLSSLGLSRSDNYENTKIVRDELMDVMAEESCHGDDFDNEDPVRASLRERRYTSDDLKEALEYLAQSDSSDSASISSVDSDALFQSDEDVDIESLEESKTENVILKECCVQIARQDLEEVQKLQAKAALKNCYVKLEQLRVLRSRDHSTSSSSEEDSEIERLCDLSTLDRKRRGSVDSGKEERKKRSKRIKRKREKLSDSGSETSDFSDFSSKSESELEKSIMEEDPAQTETTTLDPNEILTEIVCHTIHDSDSDFSSDDEAPKSNKANKNSGNKKKGGGDSISDSWKNDPLLKGSLELPLDIKKEKLTKRKRQDSDSDFEDVIEKKSRLTKNLARKLDPDWESDPDSASSSSSEDSDLASSGDDSDVEILDESKPGEQGDDSERKPGRRNILSVLSNADLNEETQRAKREEEERVMRLEMRDQQRGSQTQDVTENRLVLDTMPDGYEVTVDLGLVRKLYQHQVHGVKFMWDACYESVEALKNSEGTGCILAHNMGLGKTLQVVTLVHTLFCHRITNTKHVLVVCPLSTVSGWVKEFQNALMLTDSGNPNMPIVCVQSSDDSDRKFSRVSRWKSKGGVLIVGYEAFEKLTNIKKNNSIKCGILRSALIDPGPDLVICDEGHLLKNGKSLRTKALMEIRTKRRIALTGTPLQNNLTEYYHMVQFVKPNLLGTKHEFCRQFANPIMNGQYEDSVEADIKLMKKRTHVLHRLLKNTVQRYESSELKKYLLNLKDYALFIQLHPVQEKLYKTYIEMARGRVSKMPKKFNAFFYDYQLLKFICSHPQLLYTMEAQNLQQKKRSIRETDVIGEEPEVREVEGIPGDWWKSVCPQDVQTNLEFGTKLQVMMGIIDEAERVGEKVLIFTGSLVELSSIEYFLKLKGTPSCSSWCPKRDYFRMDGTVPPALRTMMCDKFNDKNNKKLRLFIMSHKVGGLGLNLVGANRVILLGANFNPSYDTQSIYRAYRFGQDKCVSIYRLLSMGTMEEKIYHRCVTKLAIASRVVDKHQIARHYKNLDLEDLYTVAVDLSLERSTPKKPDDDILSNILLKYDCIHKYHQHQKLLENRPDEDLDEEDKIRAWEEFKQMEITRVSCQKSSEQPKNPSEVKQGEASKAPSLPDGGVPRSPRDLVGDIMWEEKLRLLNQQLFGARMNGESSTSTQTQNGSIFQKSKTDKNSPQAVQTSSKVVQKSVSIGPNPFSKGMPPPNKGPTIIRKTSSDDFQKPMNVTKKKVCKRTIVPSNAKEGEDDDVIIVEPNKQEEFRKAMDHLRRNSIQVSNVPSVRTKENPDSFVIEIL